MTLKDTFGFSVFYLILQSVLVSVFYSKPQRLDVYVNDNLVAPTNAQWNAANTDYTLKKPVYAGAEACNVTENQFRQYNKQFTPTVCINH